MTNEPGLGGDPASRGGQRAVFLSYASEDATAAQRICTTLRAAGIEVWFDQSELRGGDAWDGAIRKQIKSCALFIPVISANAHARIEGYFRLEWKLAVDRSHLIAADQAFLLPVVIDGTPQTDERIPDRFRELQWSRLPAGETPPAFVERVLRLLSPELARAPAQVASQAAAARQTALRQPAPSPASSQQAQRVLLMIAAVVVIGVGYLAVDRFILSKRRVAGAQTAVSAGQPGAPAPSAIPEKSIAVLPFVDLSEKKDQEYFSDGLAEELLDLLAQVPDLQVAARTSSFYFKNKPEKIGTIAHELGVAHVLEGSVRKSGNTIRVTTQLIRADNGYHLWSRTYDRDVKDIFKVQDEIAAAVVEALKARLLPTQEVVNQHRTANTAAYEQYLLGRQSLNRGSPDGLHRAVAALQQAIALDPNYASAYATLAMAKSFVDADAEAIAAANRAVVLAPGLAEAYAARGYVRWRIQWDWSGARADLEKALQLDPHESTSQRRYAGLLLALGYLPEATAAVQTAIKLDPLDVPNWVVLSRCLAAAGQYVAAHRAVTRLLEISPEYSRSELATVQLLEGQTEEALRIAKQRPYSSLVAMAEHTLGHAKESQQALDELIAKHGQDSPTNVAEVYAWRSDADRAFEYLDHAYRQHDQDLGYFKVDPLLASLRGDPRYKALLRKMNLPE